LDWSSFHTSLELFLGIHSHETRTIFILVNTVFISIQFLVLISIIISMIRFHKRAKAIDVIRLKRLEELDTTVEIHLKKVDHMCDQLNAIEKAIQLCHELHRRQ